jgi:hypothetical protein
LGYHKGCNYTLTMAIKAGVVKIAAGPVAVPEAVALQ